MAPETRHAAWHDERSFAVRLLPEEGDPTELVSGLGDFLEAVDFAVEWLAREDPERTGTAGLAIFETRGGEAEKVWAYPPDQPPEGEQLTKIFGFDPVNWKPAGAEFAHSGPARGTFFPRALETAPPVNSRSARARSAPRALPSPPQPTVVAPEDGAARVPSRAGVAAEDPAAPVPSRTRLEPRMVLAAAWADRVSRACLLLAGVALWFSLALADPSFLVLLLVALSGLWWRRDKLVGTAETDGDDWL